MAAPGAGALPLEEMLRQRAKAALESAKLRQVMRENQQLANDVVQRLIRRVILKKLSWVEENRRERERFHKKLYGWSGDGPLSFPGTVPEQRQSRRRERRKEPRNRAMPEYEEVPGGGQFIMMMLRRNQAGDGEAKPSNGVANGKAGSNGARNAETLHADPAILCVGVHGLELLEAAAAPAKAPRSEPLAHADQSRVAGARHCFGGSLQSLARAEAAKVSEAGAAEAGAAEAGTAEVRAAEAKGAEAKGAEEAASTAGSDGADEEALMLESLLPSSLLPPTLEGPSELSPDSQGRNAEAGLPRVSKASMKIFGRLQSLMGGAPDTSPPGLEPKPPPPLIPPMPGFGGIWGLPADGPATPPGGSPWAPTSTAPVPEQGHPWAPLPPGAEAEARSRGRRDREAAHPRDPEDTAAHAAAKEVEGARKQQGPGEKRGRRGGKHRDRERRAERLQDQDLWDMPHLPGRPGAPLCDDPGLLDLPEFFRDNLAPRFVPDVLESPHSSANPCSGSGPTSEPLEDALGDPSEGLLLGWSSDGAEGEDDADDEVLLGRQLLG